MSDYEEALKLHKKYKNLIAHMALSFLTGIMPSHTEDAFSAKMALVCHGNTF